MRPVVVAVLDGSLVPACRLRVGQCQRNLGQRAGYIPHLFQVSLGRAANFTTLSAHDPEDSFITLITQPPGSAEAEPLLTRLEDQVRERVDPEKLRWKRLISELAALRRNLSEAQSLRVLAVLSFHPVAQISPSTALLLEVAVEKLGGAQRFSLEPSLATDADKLASAAFVVAHDCVQEPYNGSRRNGNSSSTTMVAQTLFWDRLVPRALSAIEPLPIGAAHADLLLAIAIAWPTSHLGAYTCEELHIGVVLQKVLEDARCNWRKGLGAAANSWTLARLVGAFGLLAAQDALPEASTTVSSMGAEKSKSFSAAARHCIVRSLGIEVMKGADLPTMLLFNLGLEGLGLGANGDRYRVLPTSIASQQAQSAHLQRSRLGDEVAARLTVLLEVPGGSSGGLRGGSAQPRDVVRSVLLLRACGRLKSDEPMAFLLLQAAANAVDSLQPGEKGAMRIVLHQFAVSLGCLGSKDDCTSSDNSESSVKPVPGSREARICALARYDWFARKSRAQVSWFRQRGAVR